LCHPLSEPQPTARSRDKRLNLRSHHPSDSTNDTSDQVAGIRIGARHGGVEEPHAPIKTLGVSPLRCGYASRKGEPLIQSHRVERQLLDPSDLACLPGPPPLADSVDVLDGVVHKATADLLVAAVTALL
jgi:hypothetical protein